MDMLKQLEEGLQLHREQQDKLVEYWLKQHDTVYT
jgi:hypothetical protein